MKQLSELVDDLEIKFFKVNQKLQVLKNENEILSQHIEQSSKELSKYKKEIESLQQMNADLKMTNALLGSEENKKETKLKINSMIRDINYCIAQLAE